ncbi:MAG: tyrosine--tRNA ligase [Candidatus Hydrogenedentes bacterium]|nr:tyrosine--tRNA ligase [Candidatus Hydrogenedentota bacterium]
MGVLEELQWRGFVHQATHEDLAQRLEGAPLTFYCGFDPTADSLHVGSLLPIFAMAHLQRAGHRPLVLIGGGTGLIGDPSGKTAERTLQTKEQVLANAEGQRRQLARFLDFEGPAAARMLNNADWLLSLTLVDFLRDIGKHFSINVMLTRESVRMRLEDREHGLSYTEFSYTLLQAYDFLHLCEHQNCRLQIGGSDQWGNIVSGMDLTRRLLQKETYGMTVPLLTKPDGSKFGKSEGGNIWLDPARTSPYKFYQFWINHPDAEVVRYLRFFTFLSRSEIEALEEAVLNVPEKREAQRRLAEEVTRIVHGEEALRNAVKASEAMFGGALDGLDEPTLLDVFSEVPSTTLPAETLEIQPLLTDVLVEAGCFPSKGEARRMIKSGGLYVNNERIEREDLRLSRDLCLTPSMAVVRKGKKHYQLLRFQ